MVHASGRSLAQATFALAVAILLVAVCWWCPVRAQVALPRPGLGPPGPRWRPALADDVRTAFQHAWRGYVRDAWGHDELRPLSRTPFDWYRPVFGRARPLLITAVDALDTMVLMGLTAEAEAARHEISTRLRLDADQFVQGFEVTIRVLGGLLSGYQLTGDQRLLDLAEELGERLLPMFGSPTGLPYRYVNLASGRVRDPVSSPGEAGTLLLEFGTLAKLTNRPIFYDRAKRAMVAVYQRRSALGLVGSWINVETGVWTDPISRLGGPSDSYYEYQLKCWLLFGDNDCRAMWLDTVAALRRHHLDVVPANARRSEPGLWFGQAHMLTGARTSTVYGSLEAFYPAALALGGHLDDARALHASSWWLWRQYGMIPDGFDYRTGALAAPGYPLRPEIIESAYYLQHFALRESDGEADRYFEQARMMFDDLLRCCRTGAGFAVIEDVRSRALGDLMPSYLLAETFKYLYLIAAPHALDFDGVVFTTEAHPLRRTW